MSAQKSKAEPRKSWIVRIRCVVIKDVVVEDCTEEEAREDPFAHSLEEIALDQPDWDVISVRENE